MFTSWQVIVAGTARRPPTFVAALITDSVRVSFVPSLRVAVTVVGPPCEGAAVGTVPHAGRAIGAGLKQISVSLRPPALRTSLSSTSPMWTVERSPLPVKIAWMRSDGDGACAEATAGASAAPAMRAPTTARIAFGRNGTPWYGGGRRTRNAVAPCEVAPGAADPSAALTAPPPARARARR